MMVQQELNLTIRLTANTGQASCDDGRTVELSRDAQQSIATLIAESNDFATAQTDTVTATAAASLAESQYAVPAGNRDHGQSSSGIVQCLSEVNSTDLLPVTDLGPSKPLATVLSERMSVRRLHHSDREEGLLGTVLGRVGLCRYSWVAPPDGYLESSRNVPSAGACHEHALVALIQNEVRQSHAAWVLDPYQACLRRTNHTQQQISKALTATSNALRIETPPPIVVFAVARPDLLLNRYPAGISLLWRDAGVLLGSLQLAATDVGLDSCIVGIAGQLHPFQEDPHGLFDTGAVAMGSAS
jgi:SagB-type dehydrogenase family enzyme